MLKFELYRKSFHSLAIIFPLIYFFSSKTEMILILISINFFVLIIDIFRHHIPIIQDLVDKIFSSILKPEEQGGSKKLSGSSYMFLGFLLTAIFFVKTKVITAWLILILADSIAALIGRKFGKPLPYYGKSIVGSSAFAITSLMIGIIMTNYFPWGINLYRLILAVILTSTAEFYSNKLGIDDNLLIPVVFCLAA